MSGKIAASLANAAAEVRFAGDGGHHLTIGPGEPAISEWATAGLTLPDLAAMRRYRIDRVTAQLATQGYDGIIVMDPMNIRYVTDTTNMQLWVMHNGARYAFVSADGHVILWDYYGCDYLAAHSAVIDEVRPAIGSTYFLAGPRHAEQATRWTNEMIAVITEHCGPNPRIAVDQCHHVGYRLLEDAGVQVGFGQEVMELARAIKGADEILAMRCAINACETTMTEMHTALEPGMTERELWALLHAGNIRRGGEWIETQIIASGPRTNPWMQEASSRVIEPGDIVAYDTDLVGAYGMMVDISRTWIAGEGRGQCGGPTASSSTRTTLPAGRSNTTWHSSPRADHSATSHSSRSSPTRSSTATTPASSTASGNATSTRRSTSLKSGTSGASTGSSTWEWSSPSSRTWGRVQRRARASGRRASSWRTKCSSRPTAPNCSRTSRSTCSSEWARHTDGTRPTNGHQSKTTITLWPEPEGYCEIRTGDRQSVDSAASFLASSSRGSGASPKPILWKRSALR